MGNVQSTTWSSRNPPHLILTVNENTIRHVNANANVKLVWILGHLRGKVLNRVPYIES
jgi:hypothetical protein